jgi:hypothetical protein
VRLPEGLGVVHLEVVVEVEGSLGKAGELAHPAETIEPPRDIDGGQSVALGARLRASGESLERMTRFELATSTVGRASRSGAAE